MNKIVVGGKLVDAWHGRDGVFYIALSADINDMVTEPELARWIYEQADIQITLDKVLPIKIRESV